jgi:uncharacterized protein YkwD
LQAQPRTVEPKASAVAADDAEMAESLIAAHNREREKAGLAPLKSAVKLTAAAQVHAKDMAAHEKMTHEGSDGSTPSERVEKAGYPYQNTGENVAAGQTSVDEVMTSWMNSPGHKANILGDFTEIGVARAFDADDRPYWCVDFGTPWPKLDPSEASKQLITAINHEREEAKLAPLKPNEVLSSVASRYAKDSAASGKFESKDDEGLSPFERAQKEGYHYLSLGELASAGRGKPEKVVSSWIEEKKEKGSLLGDFDDIGVGYATTGKGVPYWVVLFGTPADR